MKVKYIYFFNLFIFNILKNINTINYNILLNFILTTITNLVIYSFSKIKIMKFICYISNNYLVFYDFKILNVIIITHETFEDIICVFII